MKFLFLGDMVVDRPFQYSSEVAKLFESHYCVGNLEAPFTEEAIRRVKAGNWIRGREEFLPSLAKDINAVTLANNHMMDWNEEGLDYTRLSLTQQDIEFCGGGDTSEEAHAPLLVGDTYIFSVCENEYGAATKNKKGVAVYDDLRILYRNIQKYKNKGKIVVCYHGGSETIPIPQTYIRERFNLLREFGADLVIGTHPHVVQGYEDKIFYSLGNCYFPDEGFAQYKNTDWSLAVSFDSETLEATPIPLRMEGEVLTLDSSTEGHTELQRLSDILQSSEYENLSDAISCILHESWYPDMFKSGDLPALTHYMRCDAHQNNIVRGVSRLIGEYVIHEYEKYGIVKEGNSIEVKEL